MRQAVRYVSRFPSAPMLPEIEALIGEHELMTRVTRQQSGEDETAAIGELGEAIGRVDVFADIPALMAKALGDGLSLEGAGEALSIGAAGLFLRSLGGNPMDVHLHTSANIRRYLLKMDGLSLRNKLLAAADLAFRPGDPVDGEPVAAGAAARLGGRRGPAAADARSSCSTRSPTASTPSRRPTGPGQQSRADEGGAGGQGNRQPRPAIRQQRL